MTVAAVLALIDAAPVFVDPGEAPASSAGDAMRAGLAALEEALALVRAAEGDARDAALTAAGVRLGVPIAAGHLHAALAKAALLEAAAACGMVRDIGLDATKRAVAAAVRAGKPAPRKRSQHVRREATALSQPRPGEAGNSAA